MVIKADSDGVQKLITIKVPEVSSEMAKLKSSSYVELRWRNANEYTG